MFSELDSMIVIKREILWVPHIHYSDFTQNSLRAYVGEINDYSH